jgi:hypothetical protein
MIYVGIDLHRKRSQIAALDEQGTELLSCRVANDAEALKVILAELGGELGVALEATSAGSGSPICSSGRGRRLDSLLSLIGDSTARSRRRNVRSTDSRAITRASTSSASCAGSVPTLRCS